ncbi:MAG TPA: YndJ family transporter [Gemmataceae bacterium]|nr:YndJ family transporter [Gemmataceae bacterium]
MSWWSKFLGGGTLRDWQARATAGGVAWLIGVGALQPGWGIALLLLAPLVVVPLALALLPAPAGRAEATLRRGVAWLQLPAALVLFGAAAANPGIAAALCAVPWFCCTALLALVGGLRLKASQAEWCADVGLLYLAIGGGWLMLSALGARPLDFSTEIVRATATHFHYAGLVLPLLAGRTARTCSSRLSRAAAICIVVGVPLVAAGITLSAFGVRQPELLAAWFLAGASIVLAACQLSVAVRMGGLASLLLSVSGLSLIAGMILAMLYSLGRALGADWLDIPLMLRTHGVINAFGFALPGLLAWNLVCRLRLSEKR